jgi:hypothetical protein
METPTVGVSSLRLATQTTRALWTMPLRSWSCSAPQRGDRPGHSTSGTQSSWPLPRFFAIRQKWQVRAVTRHRPPTIASGVESEGDDGN